MELALSKYVLTLELYHSKKISEKFAYLISKEVDV